MKSQEELHDLMRRIAEEIDAAWDGEGDMVDEVQAVESVARLLVRNGYMEQCIVCGGFYFAHRRVCPYEEHPSHEEEDEDDEPQCPICYGNHLEEDHV